MPPTRWKQEEEEEGKGNHRQTLNSLTPPDCKRLLSPSRTAEILLPFPLVSNSQFPPASPRSLQLPQVGRAGTQCQERKMTAGHLQVKVTQSPALPRASS